MTDFPTIQNAYVPVRIKKQDILLRHVAQPNSPVAPLYWDMTGFESVLIDMYGGAGNAFQIMGSNNLVEWTPVPVDMITSFATQPSATFNPQNGALSSFAVGKTHKYMRLFRSTVSGSDVTAINILLSGSPHFRPLIFNKAYA